MAKREWEKMTISITPEQKEAREKRAEEACSISLLVRKAIDMFLAQPALFGVIEKPEPTAEEQEGTGS